MPSSDHQPTILITPQPIMEFNHHHSIPPTKNSSSIKPTPSSPPPTSQILRSSSSPSHPPPPPPHHHPRRFYETQQANLIFCCAGRLLSSRPSLSIPLGPSNHASQPQSPSQTPQPGNDPKLSSFQRRIYLPLQTMLSVSILIGVPTLFIYSTGRSLIHTTYPGQIILALFIYIWLISLSSMFKTVTSDPGILPRGLDPNPEMRWKPGSIDLTQQDDHRPRSESLADRSKPTRRRSDPTSQGHPDDRDHEKADDRLEVGEWEILPRWVKVEIRPKKLDKKSIQSSSNPHHPLNSINRTQASQQHSQLENQLEFDEDYHQVGWVRSKWCTTCQSYRPPRSSHCRICDCCIEGIDHHCSYLNNCIGSRNYRTFFAFLVSSCLDLMLMIGGSIWKLFFDLEHGQKILDNLRSNPIDIFVAAISILLLIPILALLGYHIYLTINCLTTVEYIKSQTTKKVIKENKKLINELLQPTSHPNPSPGLEGAKGRNHSCWSTVLGRLIGINHPPHQSEDVRVHQLGDRESQWMDMRSSAVSSNLNQNKSDHHHPRAHLRSPHNFMISRLCRPDTEPYIDWHSFI